MIVHLIDKFPAVARGAGPTNSPPNFWVTIRCRVCGLRQSTTTDLAPKILNRRVRCALCRAPVRVEVEEILGGEAHERVSIEAIPDR